MKRLTSYSKVFLPVLGMALASLVVISQVAAEVDELGPENLTNGSYTNENQPELEFLLSYEGEDFPLTYRIELADEPDNWVGGGNSRVVRYDLGGIEAEDLDNPLINPFTFTVGQAEGDGVYGTGGEDQILADGPYWWRVRTTDSASPTPVDSPWLTAGVESLPTVPAFIVDTTGPEFPEGITSPTHTPAVWSKDEDIEITWVAAVDPNAGSEPGSGLDGYYWVFDTNPTTDPDGGDESLAAGATGVMIDDVADGNNYYFHIRAFDELGNLGETATIGPFYIDATPPTTPGEPSAGAEFVNINNPQLTWSAANFSISGPTDPAYTIEYGQDEDLTEPEIGTSNTNQFTPPALDDGTWYFRVYATDAAGNDSLTSDVGSVTIDTQNLQITDVIADPGNTSAIITWETNKPANSLVEFGVTDDYGSEESDLDDYVTEHSIEIEGLLECTTYFYSVTSVDQATNSATSGGHSFTTTGCVGDSPVLDQTQAEIAEEDGGSVELIEDDVGIELEVPAGFSASDAVFQIKKLDAGSVNVAISSPEGYSWVGNYVYDLKALVSIDDEITEFDQPIQITIYFSEADLAGIDLATVQIFRWFDGGDEWLALESCLVDEIGLSVTCETSNFSVFGLFGEGTPVPPTPTPTPQASSASGDTSAPTVPGCSEAKPLGVPDLFQIDVKGNQATLYFVPVAESVNKYVVAYGYEPGAEQFGVEFDQGPSDGVLSYTIGELPPHTTFYFRIRASNGCMPGDWSNQLQIRSSANGGTQTNRYYKNFIHQVVSSLPGPVTSMVPVVTSNQASEVSQPPAPELTAPTDTEAGSDAAGAQPSESPEPQRQGFWSWLMSLFGR